MGGYGGMTAGPGDQGFVGPGNDPSLLYDRMPSYDPNEGRVIGIPTQSGTVLSGLDSGNPSQIESFNDIIARGGWDQFTPESYERALVYSGSNSPGGIASVASDYTKGAMEQLGWQPPQPPVQPDRAVPPVPGSDTPPVAPEEMYYEDSGYGGGGGWTDYGGGGYGYGGGGYGYGGGGYSSGGGSGDGGDGPDPVMGGWASRYRSEGAQAILEDPRAIARDTLADMGITDQGMIDLLGDRLVEVSRDLVPVIQAYADVGDDPNPASLINFLHEVALRLMVSGGDVSDLSSMVKEWFGGADAAAPNATLEQLLQQLLDQRGGAPVVPPATDEEPV